MSTFPIFRMKRETQSKNQNSRQRSQSLYLLYAGKFIEFHRVLEKAKEIFAREQIWPDQCDYLIHKMKPLRNTAASIASRASSSRKLENGSAGPLPVSPVASNAPLQVLKLIPYGSAKLRITAFPLLAR